MLQQFLVEVAEDVNDRRTFASITATDERSALEIFLRTYAPTDAAFLDFLYRTSANLSFAEHFWIESDDDMEQFEQGTLDVSDELFAERVNRFFGPHRDYADLYLTYYLNDAERPTFPPEMLAYIWLHSGYGTGQITVTPVS